MTALIPFQPAAYAPQHAKLYAALLAWALGLACLAAAAARANGVI